MSEDRFDQIDRLGTLTDPVRRRLYLYVIGNDGEVSRDQAARSTGVSRGLAAFHLDRLVEAGLLSSAYRRLSGKTGPGAGRPSKLYVRAPAQFDVSLPQRRYELAARVLAEIVSDLKPKERLAALRKTAGVWGARMVREIPPAARRGKPLSRAARALETFGYEPWRTPEGEIVLRNCPFDSLRRDCAGVTCGMNLAIIEGMLHGLDLKMVEARLAPHEGRCCVVLREEASGRRSRRSV